MVYIVLCQLLNDGHSADISFSCTSTIRQSCWTAIQVDAIYSALNAMGFKDVEIVVAETGWPYKGDANEVGPSVENAKAYNGNLINHLKSMAGTPLMPGKSVDTYIFALYDEDLKPGAGSEKWFGIFKPDLSATYDVGLSKSALVITNLSLIEHRLCRNLTTDRDQCPFVHLVYDVT